VRTDRLEREHGVVLCWSVFPLHPEIPEEGVELERLLAVSKIDLKVMQTRLVQIASREGLAMDLRSRAYNTRNAQELGKWAESRGRGDAFRRAVYQAYFVEERNIARVDNLVRIAEDAGLPGFEARTVVVKHTFKAAVNADWERARMLGVNAVPTHICNGERLVGFHPYDDFLRLIGKG
jgi:predicted DsbA family dithiol-disulfide isomerase